MMKISSVAVLVFAVVVIEASWSHRKKPNQCSLQFCQTNLEVRTQLTEKICPDACEGISCSGHGTCYNGRCTCNGGYFGCDCETFDRCFGVDCENGGVCQDGMCNCPKGFEGLLCETNQCDCIDCNEHGTCVAGECQCDDGFEGEFCQNEIDPCDTVVCNNGGSCDSSNGQCTCAMGFEGVFCDVPVNPCMDGTCLNGGTCLNPAPGQFVCECTIDFGNINCQTAIQNPCISPNFCVTADMPSCPHGASFASTTCSLQNGENTSLDTCCIDG